MKTAPGKYPGPPRHSWRSGRGLCLRDILLDLQRLRGKLDILRLGEEPVEPAAGIDRAQGRSGYAQTERPPERFRHQRGLVQVRKEPAPGLVVGVADIVANHRPFSGQFAAARHRITLYPGLGRPSPRRHGRRPGQAAPEKLSAGITARAVTRQALTAGHVVVPSPRAPW